MKPEPLKGKDFRPHYQRDKKIREYTNVPILLREIFNIPKKEMIIDFYWDKKEGRLKLETIICD